MSEPFGFKGGSLVAGVVAVIGVAVLFAARSRPADLCAGGWWICTVDSDRSDRNELGAIEAGCAHGFKDRA